MSNDGSERGQHVVLIKDSGHGIFDGFTRGVKDSEEYAMGNGANDC